MVLQKTTVTIPATLGLRDDIDPQVMETQGVYTANNVVWDDSGQLSKRPGSTELSKTLFGESAGIIMDKVRDITGYGTSLYAVARKALAGGASTIDHGYSLFKRLTEQIGSSNKWQSTGWCSPCIVSTTPLTIPSWENTNRLCGYDFTPVKGYDGTAEALYIAVVTNRYDTAAAYFLPELSILDFEDGTSVMYRQGLETGGGLHKVFAHDHDLDDSEDVYCVYSRTSGGNQELRVVRYNNSGTAFTLAGGSPANLGSLGNYLTTGWFWDAVHDGTGNLFVVRVNNGAGNVVVVEKISLASNTTSANTSFTITGAVTVSNFLNCSIVGSYLVIMYCDSASDVWFECLKLSDLSAVGGGGPQCMTTSGTPIRAQAIGDGEFTSPIKFHVCIDFEAGTYPRYRGYVDDWLCTADHSAAPTESFMGDTHQALCPVRGFSIDGRPYLIVNNSANAAPSSNNEYPTWFLQTHERWSTTRYRRTVAHVFPGSADDARTSSVTNAAAATIFGYASVHNHPVLGSSAKLAVLARDDGGLGDHFPTLHLVTFDFRHPSFVASPSVSSSYPQPVGFAHDGTRLHVASGGFLAYETKGVIREVGFLDTPQEVGAVEAAAGGHLEAGKTYYYKVIYEYIGKDGELVRSAPSLPLAVVPATGSTNQETLTIWCYKKGYEVENAYGGAKIVVYRTKGDGSIYYRLPSGHELTATDGVSLSTRTIVDTWGDTSLSGQEIIYTQSGELENYAPPACSIIAIWKGRIFVVNAERPTELRYSKVKQIGYGYEFNPLLALDIPEGGAITGLAVMDDKLIVFKDSSIYAVVGDGLNSVGSGSNFVYQQVCANDGATQSGSILATDEGCYFFGANGISVLSRQMQVAPIGQAVLDTTTGNAVMGAAMFAHKPWVTFAVAGESTATSKVCCIDTRTGAWSTWSSTAWYNTIGMTSFTYTPPSSSIAYSVPVMLCTQASGNEKIYAVNPVIWVDESTDYLASYATGWIAFTGKTEMKKVYWVNLLGRLRSPCKVYMDVAKDYVTSGPTTYVFDFSAGASGDVINVRASVGGRPMSVMVKAYESSPTGTKRGFDLTAISFEVGVQPGRIVSTTSTRTG